jgi:hypothetical protein
MRYLLILLISISACQSLPDNQIEKFKLINEALNQNLKKTNEASFFALKSYRRFVEYEGNPAEIKANSAIMQNLAKKVYLLIEEIEQIKNQIKSKTPQEAEKLMLGESKNGLAYQVKSSLDQYRKYLITNHKVAVLSASYLHPFAEGNENNPRFNNTAYNKQDFAQANFQNTSIEAMLAILTQKQWQVLTYQQEIMKAYGAGEISYINSPKNRWQVWAHPQHSVLKAGEEYQAQMFFVRKSHIIPAKQLTLDGNEPLGNTIELGIYQKLLTKPGKHNLEIHYKTNDRGKDTTLILNYPYYVFANPKTN